MRSLLPPELQSSWDVRDTKTRRERMVELAFAGYRVPRCGPFKDMVRLGVPLVVYTDEYAHCGEGKVLWDPTNAFCWPMDTFCSEYVFDERDEWDDTLKCSRRHSRRALVVGSFLFVVGYRSAASWMSNVDGSCEVEDCHRWPRGKDSLPYPMYAVDFTKHDGEFYHFDLNTCPGVPTDAVNMAGRDVLQASVAEFCKERGLV